MQDRGQKTAALRYAVAKRWLPQLELDVSTFITIAKSPTNITDVDVYASIPDDFVGFRNVVIDCKTRKGESPISRALWQKGLMERLGADRGICVLRVPRIEPDHRYTAAQLGITLLSEAEFPAYSAATLSQTQSPQAAIAEIDRWDQFFKIPSRFEALEPAIKFSRSGFWMSESEAEACTRTIFLVTRLRPELDPEKPEHLTIVADLTALFAHALARIVTRIFAAYLQPGQQSDLAKALLFFLYGGRSSYDNLNRLKRMIVESHYSLSGGSTDASVAQLSATPESAPSELFPGASATTLALGTASARGARRNASAANVRVADPAQRDASARDLSLPEWDRFVELVRQLLDAPLEVSRAPLLLREIAWSALGEGVSGNDGVTTFARTLASESPQGARFAVLALDYLCRAARLPREFSLVLTARLLASQSKR